ncbi:coat protein [Saesbyeol virus]|uniref:coat protein n=1 Tax=Saesbyeol virus TaxID=2320522 RepID=UPI000EB66FEA|nr:coat protein [Saesbyeol virus]AXY66750.1 coat protein [Saesbyeol virus]
MVSIISSPLKEISLDNNFAAGFLTAVSPSTVKRPSEILVNNIIQPFNANSFYSDLFTTVGDRVIVDCDKDLTVVGEFAAKPDIAVVSYMLSAYYKDQKKTCQTATRYNIKIPLRAGEEPTKLEFYNLRNYSLKPEDGELTSDQDLMLASVIGLNMCVQFHEGQGDGRYASSIKNNSERRGIKKFSQIFIDNDHRMSVYKALSRNTKTTAVKLFNTACMRKSHQFYGDTPFYCPELAAATTIVGVMSSQGASPGLIKITNSSLKKIAKAVGALDTDLIIDLMDFTIGGSSTMDAPEIFAAYRARKTSARLNTGLSHGATGPVSFQAEASRQ